MNEAAGAYARVLLREGPRVLGMIDRDPSSGSRGCADRTWWAWKFTDAPAPRMQEAACVLAFLEQAELPGSPWRGAPRLGEWLAEVLRFWTRLQHADGSFDEAYPFERSLAATSFTTFYVAEALGFAGERLPAEVRAAVITAASRAGDWLCGHDEDHGVLSNHLAAAAACLAHVHRLSGQARHARRARHFVDRIMARQSAEGWYEEYGGADPGYQTHGSFYLARYWQLTGENDVLESLRRANRFMMHCIHPDGSLGGETASRNTQTYYPAAFEMLAAQDPAAAWIADRMRTGVGTGTSVDVGSVDVWNYYPCLNNLVFAWQAAAQRSAAHSRAADPAPGEHWFPDAGFLHIKAPRYEAFVGTAKGGVVRLFAPDGRLQYADAGFVGHAADGSVVATQVLDRKRPVRIAGRRVEVEGRLVTVSRPVMRPWRFVAFRIFSLTFGRVPAVARWLKRLLVRVLIDRRRELAVSWLRVLEFSDAGLEVTDSFTAGAAGPLARLARTEHFTTIHMGSARYFVRHELARTSAADDTPISAAELGAGAVRRASFRTEAA